MYTPWESVFHVESPSSRALFARSTSRVAFGAIEWAASMSSMVSPDHPDEPPVHVVPPDPMRSSVEVVKVGRCILAEYVFASAR
jgi:hypothetical protein